MAQVWELNMPFEKKEKEIVTIALILRLTRRHDELNRLNG